MGSDSIQHLKAILVPLINGQDFEKLESIFNLLRFMLKTLPEDQSLVLFDEIYLTLLAKMVNTGVIKQSISDQDKNILRVQQSFLKFVFAVFEVNSAFLFSNNNYEHGFDQTL